MPIYNDYISEAALDAIYVLEGHFKGAETPTRHDGKKDPPTTYYGITQNGLEQLKELRRKYGVDVPKDLLQADVNSLTKKQARDVAGYVAMHNTFVMDDSYGEDTPGYFSQLPLNVRSAILTVQHTGGTNKLKKSLNDPNAKGSLLKAIKSGDREEIAMALISKSDGTLMDEPSKSNNRGRINRYLAAVKLMYDSDNKTFSTVASRDKTFNRWRDNPNTVNNVANMLQTIYRGNIAKQNEDYIMRNTPTINLAHANTANNAEPIDEQNVNSPVPAANKTGILANLTKPIKKLFTNSEENQNVAQGNQDINLQPGPSIARGGTNQLSGRPDDQSSQSV